MDVALDYQDLSVAPPKVAARGDGQFDVTFRHRPPEGTKSVHLAASFNPDYSPVQKLDGPDKRRVLHHDRGCGTQASTSINTFTTAINTVMIPPTGSRRGTSTTACFQSARGRDELRLTHPLLRSYGPSRPRSTVAPEGYFTSRTCSSKNTPFLLEVTTSSRPSPL